jgi:hypothetical protein
VWWHTKYVPLILLCFQTSAGLFCLVIFLVHVYMVGYLDVLSEVHISIFVRWMYILVIGRATNIFV